MARDPFIEALAIACGSVERAAAALAVPGVGARVRRLEAVARVLGSARSDARRWLLALGPGIAATSGRVRLLEGDVRVQARAALLRREPVLLLEITDGAGLARLCAALGLEAVSELDGARTDNDVFVAFGRCGAEALVAHFACDRSVYGQLENHARVLEELRAESAGLGIDGLVARPVGFERRTDAAVLRQTRLEGNATQLARLDAVELERRLRLALEPLVAIQAAGRLLPAGADEERVRSLHPSLPAAFPAFDVQLAPALEALKCWPERTRLPAVRVHGDYWLANLLFDGRPERLRGIIDWDRSRADGLCGLDALHLGVASIAAWSGASMGEVLATVWDPRRRHVLFAEHLVRVERRLGLTRETLQHVAIALWLDWLWNAHVEGAPITTRWLSQVIEPPSAAIARWCRRRGGGA